MLVLIEVVQPASVETGGATNDTVDFVSLLQQKLRPVTFKDEQDRPRYKRGWRSRKQEDTHR